MKLRQSSNCASLRSLLAALVMCAAVTASAQENPPAAVPKGVVNKSFDLNYESRDLRYQVEDLPGTAQPPQPPVTEEPQLEVKENQQEIHIAVPADAIFDSGKATIRHDAEAALHQVAGIIGKYPEANVRIDGYTDDKGPATRSRRLSGRRADSIAAWLEKNGFDGDITAKGHGRANPIAPNTKPDGSDNPEGRRKNRRIEITVKKSS
jgi:outer membrane protein OmpA-like peptidoglycan-associated protein